VPLVKGNKSASTFGVMQNKEVQFSVKQLKVNDPFDVKYFLS
jgi:hypothetical protein